MESDNPKVHALSILQKSVEKTKKNLKESKKDYLKHLTSSKFITILLHAIYNEDTEELKYLGVLNYYYAGGTLCVDLQYDCILLINLNDTFTGIISGVETKRILPIDAVKYVFGIYEKYKGHTTYYKEKLFSSCLYNLEPEYVSQFNNAF
jgi:hypothetical protein